MRRPDPVLILLTIALVAALALTPLLTRAPNRLISGVPVPLDAVLAQGRWLALLPVPLLAVAAAGAGRRLAALASLALLGALPWLAGSAARALAAPETPSERLAAGAGLWVALVLAAFAWSHALRGLVGRRWLRTAVGLIGFIPPGVLLATGALDALSLLREYAARRDAFGADVIGHLRLVALAIGCALPAGVALGFVAQRSRAARGPVFAALNILQTIPSIALFGLLIAPLTAAGLPGIGTLPAVVALALYALLPLARNTEAGLAGVAPGVLDAARGIGMSARGVLWRIEVPLALPVMLGGLRVTVVQTIGLAVVAALIGAGGLGAIVFEGLSADALDVVVLGVVPVVVLAALADASLRLLTEALSRP